MVSPRGAPYGFRLYNLDMGYLRSYFRKWIKYELEVGLECKILTFFFFEQWVSQQVVVRRPEIQGPFYTQPLSPKALKFQVIEFLTGVACQQQLPALSEGSEAGFLVSASSSAF